MNDDESKLGPSLATLANLLTVATIAAGSLACGGFQPAPKGRVVRIGGSARMAPAMEGEGWREAVDVELEHLTLHERHLAAAAWVLSGQLEHAAVAAFADLTSRLIRLGAPGDLVKRSIYASMEEARHTERCLGLASAYLGRPVTLGEFEDLDSAPRPRGSVEEQLTRLALGSLRDGALGEGIAAQTAATALEAVQDPALHAAFTMIAAEEASHAALAWDTIAWCIERGGSTVVDALEQALPNLAEHVPEAQPELEGVTTERLASFGVLSQATLGRIAEEEVDYAHTRATALIAAARQELAA